MYAFWHYRFLSIPSIKDFKKKQLYIFLSSWGNRREHGQECARVVMKVLGSSCVAGCYKPSASCGHCHIPLGWMDPGGGTAVLLQFAQGRGATP